jgi:hypothetical protein
MICDPILRHVIKKISMQILYIYKKEILKAYQKHKILYAQTQLSVMVVFSKTNYHP